MSVDVDNSVEVKPVVRRRRKAKAVDAPADSGSIDVALVDRIRGGDWREVLREVGSAKYNELRLLALK